jgi:hypothetical protein
VNSVSLVITGKCVICDVMLRSFLKQPVLHPTYFLLKAEVDH